jgi:hypothetical protein
MSAPGHVSDLARRLTLLRDAHQSGNPPIDSPDGRLNLIDFSEFTSRIRSKTARNRVRAKANFVSGIMLIWVVQTCAQKYFYF